MSHDTKSSTGFWTSLIRQFRLAWRLLWDPRVPGWTKAVPFLAFIYVISPIDFLPDPILGLGQIDDLGILLLGVRMFTELVPKEIVLQHLEAMGYYANQWRVLEEDPLVIEGEYEVKDE